MEYTEFSVGGTAEHRHDGEAGADAGAHPVVLDAVLSGRQLRRGRREGDRLGGNVMVRPNDIPNTGRFAIAQRSAGRDVRRVHISALS